MESSTSNLKWKRKAVAFLAVLYDLARFPEVQLEGLLELEIGWTM